MYIHCENNTRRDVDECERVSFSFCVEVVVVVVRCQSSVRRQPTRFHRIYAPYCILIIGFVYVHPYVSL